MRTILLACAISFIASPVLALDCIPEPKTLAYGDPVSDAWVKACEAQFRNPLPNCHRLYAKPDDRALCLGVIVKLDAYDAGKPGFEKRK